MITEKQLKILFSALGSIVVLVISIIVIIVGHLLALKKYQEANLPASKQMETMRTTGIVLSIISGVSCILFLFLFVRDRYIN